MEKEIETTKRVFEKPEKELVEEGWTRAKYLETKQPGGTIYTVSVSGKELVKRASVLARALNERGIERIKSPTRCRRIANFYATGNALLANNIIGNIPVGMVETRDGYLYLHPELIVEIVDGQHRLWGFADEYNDAGVDFEILFSFLVDADNSKKAALFYKINREQKKINPSLAFDLLEVIGEGSEDEKIAKIAKDLDTEGDSPFFDMVKVREKEPDKDARISLASMVDKTKKFLKTPMGQKFYKAGELQVPALYETLRNYYGAVREVFPEVWADKDCILVKTLGFGAFIELLSDVLTEHARRNGYSIPSKDQLLEILGPLEGFNFYDDAISSFGGEKGQRQLASILKEELGFGTFSA